MPCADGQTCRRGAWSELIRTCPFARRIAAGKGTFATSTSKWAAGFPARSPGAGGFLEAFLAVGGDRAPVSRGTVSALSHRVRWLRRAVVVMVLAAFSAAAAAPMLAAHRLCVVGHHPCETPATIADDCCCQTLNAGDHQSTTAEQRVDVRITATAHAAVLDAVAALAPTVSADRSPRLSTHHSSLDRTTLFSVLLI